ncbi:MAG: hypothetical protein WDO13_07815 [Verrucomicrobiota bacterium]
MTPITPSEITALVLSWKNRAEALGYKPGTKAYAKLEAEFFVGAMATLLALGRSHPPVWELLVLSGRSISETYSSAKEDAPNGQP